VGTEDYYNSSDPQNLVKTMILTKYFTAWSQIILPNLRGSGDRLAYVDLFAGPGAFEDGILSTPLEILTTAIGNPKLRAHLVTHFNDENRAFTLLLEGRIRDLVGIEKLRYPPRVSTVAVGSAMVDVLQEICVGPTLFFVDPWGYKGLSLDLIGTAIKSWGCDCIFFFNYNRINLGLSNPYVVERMDDLFGTARAAQLRAKVEALAPIERQAIIMDELTEALREVGVNFVLPFEFKSSQGQRTSHYIIFASKAFIGYHVMKEVMAKLSTDRGEVKGFEFVPRMALQSALFPDTGRPFSIASLKLILLRSCRGLVVSVRTAYESTTVDTPYTLRNVKDAIRELEMEGHVTVAPPASKRPKRHGEVTLADDKMVTFPA